MPEIFLKEKQVLTGMTVALYLKGKSEPEIDEEGNTMILKSLIGGIPMRAKLYPVDGIVWHPNQDEDKTRYPGHLTATSMEGFNPNVRFRPLSSFSINDAPACTRFVVFADGKRLKYPEEKYPDEYVYVKTDEQSRILSDNDYAYDFYGGEYHLPDNAVLVPISEIGEYKKHPLD